MARKTRSEILYDGCFAHVFSRALEKHLIFETEEDFRFFKSLLGRTKAKYDYRIYHYCLMNTHFHLAVSLASVKAFSRALHEIKQGYARWVHKKQKSEGPIWWGRFRSQLIENEAYLSTCGLYIETNPIKAGMVQNPEEWPHSSSRHYFQGLPDPLVDSYERPLSISAGVQQNLDFVNGDILGSELFRLQIQERLFDD